MHIETAMAGWLIDQYEVIEKLGEGGMGVVYKARDRQLDRFVALKMLTSSRRVEASPDDSASLEKEARAASALNHPHIATIHDRGEDDGSPYLVFEYLDGGTLREKLQAAGGALPITDVLRYAVEAADALRHAHRRGVVHRDIKTDNMMLTDEGALKITDFGLALRGIQHGASGATTQGTAPYMSPEQAQGLEVDERSDVFSFGVTLFELASGRVPFDGLHPAAIAYDVINTPTPSLLSLRPDAPSELDHIIQKATAKNPDDRYAGCAEMAAELEALRDRNSPAAPPPAADVAPAPDPAEASSGRGSPIRRRVFAAGMAAALGLFAFWLLRQEPTRAPTAEHPLTIAVLPFQNISNDASQDYLAAGLTDSLMTDLAHLPALRVVSRTSVQRFRDSAMSLPEIAAELEADRILEGSVLQVGDQLRISAHLVDGSADRNLWADSYEFEAAGVLEMQREVARAVAAQVQQTLQGSDARPDRPSRRVPPAAYAAFVRGRQAAFEWTPESAAAAIEEYQRAIELAPDYAEAYAGLAIAHGFAALNGPGLPRESWPKARSAAERALALDGNLDQAHAALGFVESVYDWNWGGAERSFRRALELNPGSVDARHALAMTVMAPQGRLDEALSVLREARTLDPLSPSINVNLGDLLAFRGDYEDALAQYEDTLRLHPGFVEARIWKGFVLLYLDRRDEAVQWWQPLLGPNREGGDIAAAFIDLAAGRRRQALAALERAAASAPDPATEYAEWCLFANGLSLLGEREKALDALENAYLQRSSQLLMLKVNPNYAVLRDSERFLALLRGMNLAD